MTSRGSDGAEEEARVTLLKRQKQVLGTRLRELQESLLQLSKEEEERAAMRKKMMRVMAMDVRDQEKDKTQRVTNAAAQLLRLASTGFSPETSEPCFLSRDTARTAKQGQAHTRLRDAVDAFVEHQVQRPLSRARMLSVSKRGSSALGSANSPNAHRPIPVQSSEGDAQEADANVVDQVYGTQQADLRRLHACEHLQLQQTYAHQIRAARALAGHKALSDELEQLSLRPLDQVMSLTYVAWGALVVWEEKKERACACLMSCHGLGCRGKKGSERCGRR